MKNNLYLFINLTLVFVLLLLISSCVESKAHKADFNKLEEKTQQIEKSEWVEAGHYLFNLEDISPKSISCASCHIPDLSFQDAFEVAIVNNRKLSRNTPTLLNLNRYTSFFWDGRATSIREQLEGPLFSRVEMHSSPEILYEAVTQDSLLSNMFERMDLAGEENATELVMYALEQYILSECTKETKFHLAQAKQASLSEEEQQGFEIFKNKAQCARCHFPPDFTDNQYHDIGLYRRKVIFESYQKGEQTKYQLGPDYGRGNVVPGKENVFTFRTPSLLNVALTAPYMHDGTFRDLEEVIDFYSRKDSILIQNPLSREERKNLIQFLTTLNDSRMERKDIGAVF